MRVIVKVMVIAEAIDIRPAMQRPANWVIQPLPVQVVNHCFISAFLQPLRRRVFVGHQVIVEIICGEVPVIGFELFDQRS